MKIAQKNFCCFAEIRNIDMAFFPFFPFCLGGMQCKAKTPAVIDSAAKVISAATKYKPKAANGNRNAFRQNP